MIWTKVVYHNLGPLYRLVIYVFTEYFTPEIVLRMLMCKNVPYVNKHFCAKIIIFSNERTEGFPDYAKHCHRFDFITRMSIRKNLGTCIILENLQIEHDRIFLVGTIKKEILMSTFLRLFSLLAVLYWPKWIRRIRASVKLKISSH